LCFVSSLFIFLHFFSHFFFFFLPVFFNSFSFPSNNNNNNNMQRLDRVISHLQSGAPAVSAVNASVAAVAGRGGPLVSVNVGSDGVAILTINNPPANSLSGDCMRDFEAAYKQAVADSRVKALVVTGAGRFFIAGADIGYIAHTQASDLGSDSIKAFLRKGNDFMNELEAGKKPVVAAINGPALGGGLEVAMSCHARIGTKATAYGLPELKLGIIPGLGGTQRLPRLIGAELAVKATLKSKTFKAKDALKLGIIDKIVSNKDLINEARTVALALAAQGSDSFPRTLLRNDRIGDSKKALAVVAAARAGAQKSRRTRNMPHPFAYLDAVEAGIKYGGYAGVDKEVEVFKSLVMTESARGLVHMFLASKLTSKIPGVRATSAGGPIRRVGILGSGTMGSAIAALYLLTGHEVVLKEINWDIMIAGIKRVTGIINAVAKRRRIPSGMVVAILSNFKAQVTYDNFDSLDLVIEAAVENVGIKQSIFKELESVCNNQCILATNTSTIDIDLISAKTNAQDRILGLHFFSPAHVMPLLEIVRSKYTSTAVLARCVASCKTIMKTGVVVGNCVGFTANRIFFPYTQSAALLTDHGVHPYRIDKAILKFGMPMGVFQMNDLSGLDIGVHVSGMIAGAYGDRVYSSSLLTHMVKDGRLGQKAKKGFYKYPSRKPEPDAKLDAYLSAARADAGNIRSVDKDMTEQDIVEAVLFPVVNESFRVIAEGHVIRETDVDVVSVTGYGFPAWRGGVVHWARFVGLKYVAQRLAFFAKKFGSSNAQLRRFYEPCDLLKAEAAKAKN
jgi:enoyl-CoA hydratase/3-hydroxyacyl-CoA dehydrogenase